MNYQVENKSMLAKTHAAADRGVDARFLKAEVVADCDILEITVL